MLSRALAADRRFQLMQRHVVDDAEEWSWERVPGSEGTLSVGFHRASARIMQRLRPPPKFEIEVLRIMSPTSWKPPQRCGPDRLGDQDVC